MSKSKRSIYVWKKKKLGLNLCDKGYKYLHKIFNFEFHLHNFLFIPNNSNILIAGIEK